MEFLSNILSNTKEIWGVQRRSFSLLFAHHPRAFAGLFAVGVFSALVPFISVGGVAYLLDSIVASLRGDIGVSIALATAIVILAGAIPEIIGVFRDYLDRFVWLSFGSVLTLRYAKKRTEIEIAHFEDPKLHDMLQKTEERGVWPILNLIEMQIGNLTNLVGVIVASAVLVFIDWRFLAILAIGTLPQLVVSVVYGKQVWSIFDGNAEERRKFVSYRRLTESLAALMEMRIHRAAPAVYEAMRKLLKTFTGKQVGLERKRLYWQLCANVGKVIAIALVYALAINAAFVGAITVGAILFVLTSVREFQGSLERFIAGFGKMYEWHLFAREIFRMFDLGPILSRAKEPVAPGEKHAPEIVFEHVSFRYPGSKALVLRDVSFAIPAASSCALVGINGAGKSTLVKLLARFYDPTSGRILIDGHDLRDFDIEEWHRKMGVLFQEFPNYRAFSAKEGIALGRAEKAAKKSEVVAMAKKAGADEFINAWPKKYEEIIGKEFVGGIDPSRGQLQRLALARIFYRSPKFLVLDEPTASVDAQAEEDIFREIEANKDQTRLLISHRFSTVRNADQIVVLDDGKVHEAGTHRELMERDDVYASLFRIQAKGYLEETPGPEIQSVQAA